MVGSFGDHLEDEILDHIFGCTTRDFVSPTNIFVALSTADPLDDGSGLAEPGDTYARVSTDGADWTVSSGGAVENVNAITFPEAGGNWGTLTHFALFDAASGGNMLAHGELTTPKPVDIGDTPYFAAGDLDVSLT